MLLPFGEYRPDIADLDSQFMGSGSRNAYVAANSYKPVPGLTIFDDTAMAAACRGAWYARTVDGSYVVFAATATAIYKFTGGAWEDVTRTVGGAYSLPDGEWWDGRQFGTRLILTNSADEPQYIDVDSGSDFADLPGTPPNAHLVSVVGDYLVLIRLASEPRKLQWSGTNDSESWTVGTDNSDEQEFADGGDLTGVAEIAQDTSLVLQETAIRRMTYLPGQTLVFRFDKLEDEKGCISPYGWTVTNSHVYYLSEDGFYSAGMDGITPIGAQKVNRWFLDNSDADRRTQVHAIADPFHPRVFFAFHSASSATYFDTLLAYDWQLDRWSPPIYITAQYWAALASPGTTLDSIATALESIVGSLDGRQYEGARPTLGAISSGATVAFMTGSNLEAVLETAEMHPLPGMVAHHNEQYPLIDAENLTIRVGLRNRLADSVRYTSSSGLNPSGSTLCRVEVTIPEGEDWTDAQGVNINATPSGLR
jgi:hypothetical protein